MDCRRLFLARGIRLPRRHMGSRRRVRPDRLPYDTGIRSVDGPVIFVANHASHLDTPLILLSLPDELMPRYFTLTTGWHPDRIAEVRRLSWVSGKVGR